MKISWSGKYLELVEQGSNHSAYIMHDSSLNFSILLVTNVISKYWYRDFIEVKNENVESNLMEELCNAKVDLNCDE